MSDPRVLDRSAHVTNIEIHVKEPVIARSMFFLNANEHPQLQ